MQSLPRFKTQTWSLRSDNEGTAQSPHVRNVRTSLVLHNSKYEAVVPLDVKVAG